MTTGNPQSSSDETPRPKVLSDVSTGGVTENSVFDDPGPDPTSVAGTSSTEQAITADYGQKRSQQDLDEEAGSAESNEA